MHSSICDCHNIINCIQFYRRFRNEKEVVYHSLAYKKRQSSISYFIKYGNLFGSIVVFMYCNGKEYAIINRHTLKIVFLIISFLHITIVFYRHQLIHFFLFWKKYLVDLILLTFRIQLKCVSSSKKKTASLFLHFQYIMNMTDHE